MLADKDKALEVSQQKLRSKAEECASLKVTIQKLEVFSVGSNIHVCVHGQEDFASSFPLRPIRKSWKQDLICYPNSYMYMQLHQRRISMQCMYSRALKLWR